MNEDVKAIEEALAAEPTSGPWQWFDGEGTKMPYLTSSEGEVCNFGSSEDYYPTEGDPPSLADRQFIETCDPTRLRRVLDTMQAMGEALRFATPMAEEEWSYLHQAGQLPNGVKAVEMMRAALALYEGTK